MTCEREERTRVGPFRHFQLRSHFDRTSLIASISRYESIDNDDDDMSLRLTPSN
jgi:hypothetical protein